MIFTKELGRLAAEGRKTQMRRPIRTGDTGIVRPCPFQIGRDYAIERPSGPAHDIRLEVTSLHRARLGDITLREVRAEGHRTTPAFADDWMRTHDRAWPPVEDCHACDGSGTRDCDACFRHNPDGPDLLGEHPPGCSLCNQCDGSGEQLAVVEDDQVMARFTDRHADIQVWVITFQRSQAPRMLTPAARPAGSVLGYTSNPRNAMRDEPEVLDALSARPLGLTPADAAPTIENVQRHARSLANRLRQDSVSAARAADPASVLERLAEVQRILGEVDQLKRNAA